MTTAGDTNTALSAITTVIADLTPQATNSSNAAKSNQLQGAITAANWALTYIKDVQTLVVGY
ncbi:MAG: hypothetical protein H0X39_00065 [Actinobacteria bacterium]|nr:hypothetical protein [Actinomycetota bacterium]